MEINQKDIPYRNHLSIHKIVNLHNRSQFELFGNYNPQKYQNGKFIGNSNDIILQSMQMKPIGFWYSIKDGWIGFNFDKDDEENIIYETDLNMYELVISPNSFTDLNNPDQNKILLLNNHEFGNFEMKYTKTNYYNEISKIDWLKVSKDYSGIELPQLNGRYRMQHMWSSTWDIPSGCIWNVVCIDLLKLI